MTPNNFQINIPNVIPSNAVGSNVSTGSLMNSFNQYLTNQQNIASQLQAASAPSEQEISARNALLNFDQSYRQGMNKIENKPIAMEFITGQQAALQRQAAIERQGLAETYQALSEDRKAKVDTLQNQWNLMSDLFNTGVSVAGKQFEMDKLQREAQKLDTSIVNLDNGNTILVDNQTGQIIKNFGGAGVGSGTTQDGVNGQSTYRQQTGQNILNYIDTALSQVKFGTAGFGSNLLAKVGGSGAKNLRSTLETLKGNIGFEALQAMREASKTGGALGQVAVQELTALQSILGSLDASQSRSQLIQNLNNIKMHYQNALGAINQANNPQQTSTDDPLGLFN